MRRARAARRPALLMAAALAFTAQPVHAAEYEIFIDVDDEQELYDLLFTGQIEEETFNTLVEVLRRGVDLNTASREELYTLPNLSYEDVDAVIAYRSEVGTIDDPAALVVAGALSRRKLSSIAPFLLVRAPDRRLAATNGFVRYQLAASQEDGRVDPPLPPMALQARVSTLRDLTFGAAMSVTRLRLGETAWDPNREALSVEPEAIRVNVPKAFIQWDTEDWGVIAGTYRIGFGQRLVFDNSGRFTPNGFYLDDAVFWDNRLVSLCRESTGELSEPPCAGELDVVRVTPDFRWSDGLRGVAAGFKHAKLRKGWLQGYGFFSAQDRDLNQYQVFDAAVCEDPRADDDPRCAAPDTVKRQSDPLVPTSEYTFVTLPDLYDEYLGGANFTYFYDRRTHVGVTGYGADVRFRPEGVELDFQEWARTPAGGPWGAVGADMAWGRKWADVFAEVAYGVDSQPPANPSLPEGEADGGGGPAVLVRGTATWNRNELEVSGRYYDRDYTNPYARPIAASDEFLGLSARDEAGGRVRFNGQLFERWQLRALADAWVQSTDVVPGRDVPAVPKLLTYLRNDVQATRWLRPGLWLQYRNNDLVDNGRDQCFSGDREVDTPTGQEPAPCGGEQWVVVGRVRVDPIKRLNFQVLYQHEWLDDTEYDNRFREDFSTWFLLSVNPWRSLRLRARVRYLNEDIEQDDRLEESVWTYFDASYTFAKVFLLRARYDIYAYLDGRDSTAERIPSPENWVRLELEGRF